MSAPVLFQNMPPLSPEEYSELEGSIKEHGIQVPILLDENGVVVDGHHRQKIAEHLGVECPKQVLRGKSESEKRTLALSLNIHRRHLNREQKRGLIAESIKADPELSNREHARRTGVTDKTVGTVREELEESAEIPHFDSRIDPRTGNASQPASKPARVHQPKTPTPEQKASRDVEIINDIRLYLGHIGSAQEIASLPPKGKQHIIDALEDTINKLRSQS